MTETKFYPTQAPLIQCDKGKVHIKFYYKLNLQTMEKLLVWQGAMKTCANASHYAYLCALLS